MTGNSKPSEIMTYYSSEMACWTCSRHARSPRRVPYALADDLATLAAPAHSRLFVQTSQKRLPRISRKVSGPATRHENVQSFASGSVDRQYDDKSYFSSFCLGPGPPSNWLLSRYNWTTTVGPEVIDKAHERMNTPRPLVRRYYKRKCPGPGLPMAGEFVGRSARSTLPSFLLRKIPRFNAFITRSFAHGSFSGRSHTLLTIARAALQIRWPWQALAGAPSLTFAKPTDLNTPQALPRRITCTDCQHKGLKSIYGTNHDERNSGYQR
ncbi:hypothetical protein V8E55_001348 [Tylopilus felleus]